MANNLKSNPIYIDTYPTAGAVAISTTPITVHDIVLYSLSASVAVLTNVGATETKAILSCVAGGVDQFTPADPMTFDSLAINWTAGGITTTSVILIYV